MKGNINPILRKIAEINEMIAVRDSDGDSLVVVDKSSTWESEYQYQPIEVKGNSICISRKEVGKNGLSVEMFNLSGFVKNRFDDETKQDLAWELSNIRKMYKRAIKEL